MHDDFMPPDDPTLVRLELLGCLARAARLALQEFEQADTVNLNLQASSDGLAVDAQLFINGHAIGGWGC